MSRWTLRPLPALRGYCVEWAEPGDFLISRRNRLYRAAAPDGTFEPVLEFPVAPW